MLNSCWKFGGERLSLSAVASAQGSVVPDDRGQGLLEGVAAHLAVVDVGLRLLEPVKVLLEEDEAVWSLSDQVILT